MPDSDAVFRAAVAAHETGDLTTAEAGYQHVLASEPQHYAALLCLGLVRQAQARPDEAGALFRQAAAANASAPEPLTCLGDVELARGRPDEAIAAYEAALARRPDYVEALNNLGNALHAAGRTNDAVARFEQALAIHPDFALAHNNLAVSLQALGRLAEATEHLETALCVNPAYAEAHTNLANILRVLERNDQALAHYRAALDHAPDSADAHNGLATALHALGRPSEAISHFLTALRLRPAFPEAHNNLGNALQAVQRHEEAVAHYRAALALQPANAGALSGLGTALECLDRLPEAEAAYAAALQHDPDNLRAHQGLAIICLRTARPEPADAHGHIGFPDVLTTLPYSRVGNPVPVLVLNSVLGRNILAERWLDDQTFLQHKLTVDFLTCPPELPPHDLVVNTICDADLCCVALDRGVALLRHTRAPIIDHPAAILRTKRLDSAKRLGQLLGVRTPRTELWPRASITTDALERAGFAWPLLLRSPGFHTGFFFEKVDRAHDLAAALASLPGDELLVMEFVDTFAADGQVRKYRVLCVDGGLYPLHAAIARHWKVHYFSADMAESDVNRAEDRAFLTDMHAYLGDSAVEALERVAADLALEYAGIDFGLDSEGRVVVWEANAAINIPPLPDDERWAYRLEPVARVNGAVRTMLLRRAAPSATMG
ncbi:MAG: tetratricopeptide repeat protein [Chloroflexi bacterium]|nr:tetratricopeptide repeat protein [Chloroflexota bacterium]